MGKDKSLHWTRQVIQQVTAQKGDKDNYILAAGITPSGKIHLGNFREIITIDMINKAFNKIGKKTRFIYSWDDYDVFRKVPVNMPKQDMLKEYLRMPITDVPDTFDCNHKSYAEHNEKPLEEILPIMGIDVEYIYQSKKYRSCEYAEMIRIALQNTKKIKEILDNRRKEPLDDGWYPASIFCEKCKKDTTKIKEYDEEYDVTYSCDCGFEDTFDIRKKGIIKLLWRIDWPMRWAYEKVDFESGGKDHFAAGGSFDTAKEIVKIFDYDAPSSKRYEWIGVKGGKQFSSSAGNVITVQDALEIYSPEILRFLFAGTRMEAEFQISFDLDVLKIYEDFDKCERIYYKQEEANEETYEKNRIIYELSCVEKPSKEMPCQPKIRHITTILQINEFDNDKTREYFNDIIKNDIDKKRFDNRMGCAMNWIKNFAPEDFKFSVQTEVSKNLKLNDEQRKMIGRVVEILKTDIDDDNELHEKFYALTKELDMNVKDFFETCYRVLINKDKGPKLASFILTIGKDKVIELFNKI